jgi:hypothetical protein
MIMPVVSIHLCEDAAFHIAQLKSQPSTDIDLKKARELERPVHMSVSNNP